MISTRTRMNHSFGGGVLITPEFRAQVVGFAARTTIKNAVRKFGVTDVSIGKWMRRAGVKARPAHRPTDAEIEAFGKEWVQ